MFCFLKLKKRLRRCSRRRLPLELFESFDELVVRDLSDAFSVAASVKVWVDGSLTRLVGWGDLLRGVMMIGRTGLPTKKPFILLEVSLFCLWDVQESMRLFQGFQEVMLGPEAVVTGVDRSSQVVVNGKSESSRPWLGIVGAVLYRAGKL
jgi:hypothetical protein